MKCIGGVPILGAPYKELIPTKDSLFGKIDSGNMGIVRLLQTFEDSCMSL